MYICKENISKVSKTFHLKKYDKKIMVIQEKSKKKSILSNNIRKNVE